MMLCHLHIKQDARRRKRGSLCNHNYCTLYILGHFYVSLYFIHVYYVYYCILLSVFMYSVWVDWFLHAFVLVETGMCVTLWSTMWIEVEGCCVVKPNI